MTIDEKQNTVKRSNLYNKLYNIINQIPRKQVEYDAPCSHSCATEIEKLIHEILKKQRENDFSMFCTEMNAKKIIGPIHPANEIGKSWNMLLDFVIVAAEKYKIGTGLLQIKEVDI